MAISPNTKAIDTSPVLPCEKLKGVDTVDNLFNKVAATQP